jgi:dienelactone hydrolase
MLVRRGLIIALGAAVLTAAAVPALSARSGGQQPVVGLRIVRLVDTTRFIRLPGGVSEPRPLVTYVRYPALGHPSVGDVLDAPAAAGPFPLVVFGHGFAVTPATYAHLLRAWTRAGFVVAAPVFPLGNANAPGGPDEADRIHQPADLRFVITQLLAESATNGDPLHGLIDPTRVGVAGHSDGADTALVTAFSRRYGDPRVDAAVVLSGGEETGITDYLFESGGPALLAVQGTADTLNPPKLTYAYFAKASRPKFLLALPGARHLAPYTWQQPRVAEVEHVTIAFLDHYLANGSLSRLLSSGESGVGVLTADP